MKYGFFKIASITPKIKLGDIFYNAEKIIESVALASNENASVLSMPMLCLTGNNLGDLYFNESLLNYCEKSLIEILQKTANYNLIFFVGMPFKLNSKIFNVAFCINRGKILAIIPQNYQSKEDIRYNFQFSSYSGENIFVNFNGDKVLFGNKIILKYNNLKIAILLNSNVMDINLSNSEANLIVNLACSRDVFFEVEKRVNVLKYLSEKLCCAYIYSNAGSGEGSGNGVYSGHSLIAENGKIINECLPFEKKMLSSVIDVNYLNYQKNKKIKCNENELYENIEILLTENETNIQGLFKKCPFIDVFEKNNLNYVLEMQANALKSRLEYTKSKKIIIGVSGGLDSTYALIVAHKAIQLLNRDTKDIIGISMPCFGTTERTYNNAKKLSEYFNITFKIIDISNAVNIHLKDIGQEDNVYDVTYENAQARERTQVLMDYANKTGGLVIGTGDLSEIALGWSTYNGDHMSMFSVNSSIPKTLMQYILNNIKNTSDEILKNLLENIVSTPISPELLPLNNGMLKQKTEDSVGPYVIHDFFLYNMLYKGYSPKKLYYIALIAFENDFSREKIKEFLSIFVKRFITQQFKRNCSPDSIEINNISLSYRNFQMPSDVYADIFLKEIDDIFLKQNI